MNNFNDWIYTLSGEPSLLACRGFTEARSVSPCFGEYSEAKADGRTNPDELCDIGKYLPWFNLYNMNGCLYDPVVGRFLSADNYVQMPDFTQSYNRYSYCLNNPLRYSDPSGYTWGIFKPFVRAAKWVWNVGLPAIDPVKASSKFMDWVKKKLEPLSDAMVKAGVPDFSVGATVNGEGNVNFKASFRGQEVFNTENIDRSNATQVVIDELNEVRQSHGQAWHASSGGIDAISGAAIDAGPYIYRVWKEGMPTVFHNNQSTLVISTSSNSYLDINDKRLYWEFTGYLHNKNPNLSIRYHPINRGPDGTGMMLMEWLLVHSLIPFPNWMTKEKWDYFKDLQKVDYYRKAEIIKY